MASFFDICNVSFTPPENAELVLSATFECQALAGGDRGSVNYVRLYVDRNGTKTYGEQQTVSTTRSVQSLVASFPVAKGETVSAGICQEGTGVYGVTFWNCRVLGELIAKG